MTWKKIAYLDEVAQLGDTTPLAVDGTAGGAGTGTTASRIDHRHALGVLVADVDAGQHSWKNLIVEPLASAPSTPATAQIYYNTGDNHVYVYTP